MVTRKDVLSKAVDDCMKELYSLAQPHVKWDDFKEECKAYAQKYKEWEQYNKAKRERSAVWDEWKQLHPDWEDKTVTECIGPKPFEFYFIPKDVMNDICQSYIQAYKIDLHKDLLDTIEILKDYCKEPVVDKYIEGKDGSPGHRECGYPDGLEKEIKNILNTYFSKTDCDLGSISEELQNKFFSFLDMAGKFYNWNSDLNSFNTTVYLGVSPNSNKQAVIDNWKKYRGQDITIDEKEISEFY